MTTTMTTTTTTTTPDPREKRLLSLAKGSRFAGFAYRDSEGRAVAATDGAAFVVLGAVSTEEALERLAGLRTEGPLPSTESAQTVFRAAIAERNAAAEVAGAEFRAGALPDEAGVERAAELHREAIEREQARLAKAERGRSKADSREASLARAAFARLEKRGPASQVIAHGVRVGEAWFDLRLIDRVRRAAGAEAALVNASGAYDPAHVNLSRKGRAVGFALVMPVRF